MAQIKTTTEIAPRSMTTPVWLMPGTSDDAPKADPVSLQHLEGTRDRKRIVLLAEDNLPDTLVVEDAILRYELPVELHVVNDG